MKIEICEQMVQSWLLNHQLCQIVQTNWTVSPLRNIAQSDIDDAQVFIKQLQDGLNDLLSDEVKAALQASVDEEFAEKTSCEEAEPTAKKTKKAKKTVKKLNIIKKSTAAQFIRQCEIDVAGIRLIDGEVDRVFLVDTAFHKNGLGYHDVVATVVKKIIRAVLVAVIIFGDSSNVTVAFAAPKCRAAVQSDIVKVVGMLRGLLGSKYAKTSIELYFNEDFTEKIYEPLKKDVNKLNNDNDLFMRSLNLVQVAESFSAPAPAASAVSAGKTVFAAPSAASGKGGVPSIIFSPSDLDDFKAELMLKKKAEIIWVYSDGTRVPCIWDASDITANSKIKSNIQSRPQWRKKDKDGLCEVCVSVI